MIETAVARANALTARWAATVGDGHTTALSGAGVWPLLAYLAWAADGAGREELAAAVGMDPKDAQEAATGLIRLLRSEPGLRAAVGLWARSDVPLRDEWRQTLPAGSVGVLAVGALDAWVREQTGGLLDGMAAPVGTETLLVLATALTVRTTWKEPFEDGTLPVRTGPWAGQSMHALWRSGTDLDQLAVYDTASGPISVLSVEGDNGIGVDLVLGTPEAPAGAVLAAGVAIDSDTAPAVLGSQFTEDHTAPGLTLSGSYRRERQLHTGVPRFTVRGGHDLLETAELFGLRAVSDDRRGWFPGISDFPLAVAVARQDVTAAFTALGFEAAAVTHVNMVGGAGIPPHKRDLLFTIERPFGFVARHRASGLVLVAGWVAELEKFVMPRHQTVRLRVDDSGKLVLDDD
ncbi:serine protease inhibitor [Asanoa ferruginea]|uniref:Serine protease inhibitor n=1 Tax=Asanoa ferruginea TaxID=53367 RepID=A0A3D9ZR04_9ACTN|nr:serpin family protein [Asanoa ferruginea]REF99818.1 serine protease inhibitor [Asanoa ferruginea]GIF51836.1 hypothetical protein Afe04nite_63750 [Asanoa ferruginea]